MAVFLGKERVSVGLGSGGNVDDITINGASIVSNGVAELGNKVATLDSNKATTVDKVNLASSSNNISGSVYGYAYFNGNGNNIVKRATESGVPYVTLGNQTDYTAIESNERPRVKFKQRGDNYQYTTVSGAVALQAEVIDLQNRIYAIEGYTQKVIANDYTDTDVFSYVPSLSIASSSYQTIYTAFTQPTFGEICGKSVKTDYGSKTAIVSTSVSKVDSYGANLLPNYNFISSYSTNYEVSGRKVKVLASDGRPWASMTASNGVYLKKGTYSFYISNPSTTVRLQSRASYDLTTPLFTDNATVGKTFNMLQDGYAYFKFLATGNSYPVEFSDFYIVRGSNIPTEYKAYDPSIHDELIFSDDKIELRGIGQYKDRIYAEKNGTTYDLKLERNIGCVDLGSLTWDLLGTNTFTSENLNSVIVLPSSNAVVGGIISCSYSSTNYNACSSEATDKTVAVDTTGKITVCDKSFTTASAFKSSVSGVALYYALKTPTTETLKTGLTLDDITLIGERYGYAIVDNTTPVLDFATITATQIEDNIGFTSLNKVNDYADNVSFDRKVVMENDTKTIDLGSLDWNAGSSITGYVAIADAVRFANNTEAQGLSLSGYSVKSNDYIASHTSEKTVGIDVSGNLLINDPSFTGTKNRANLQNYFRGKILTYKSTSLHPEYKAKARINRKVGKVNLGSLTWFVGNQGGGIFRGYTNSATLADILLPASGAVPQVSLSGGKTYQVVSSTTFYNATTASDMVSVDSSGRIMVMDTSITSATEADFKNAMNGKYLYYALNSETDEYIEKQYSEIDLSKVSSPLLTGDLVHVDGEMNFVVKDWKE